MISAVIYDTETLAIPHTNGNRNPAYVYADGWEDFEGLGISVLCALDMETSAPHVFFKDDLSDFVKLVNSREHLIGFNSKRFDDRLLAANGYKVKTTFDFLEELRLATGQPAEYVKGQTRAGFSLDNLVRLNLRPGGKVYTGKVAPQLWQMGERGKVISYCMDDVLLLDRLLSKAYFGGIRVPHPTDRDATEKVRPESVRELFGAK